MSWFSASLSLMMLSCCWSLASAEWVDMPQFSNQHKVYRLPIKAPQSDRRVFESDAYDTRRFQTYDNIRRFGIQKETSLRNISLYPDDRRRPPVGQFGVVEAPYTGTIATFTTERVVTSIAEANNDDTSETDVDDSIEVESAQGQNTPQYEEVPSIYSSNEDTSSTMQPIETTTLPMSTSTAKKSKYSNRTSEDDKGFLDYLPVDLLKRVHKKLKSQPPTLRGKILFLKEFERTLLGEIQSRLSAALAPKRIPRGARGHDYDEHGLGFPSLEGTLMAISFLTFAVYLVRLVMMLFRNATNSAAAPIFLGRRKRSIDDVNSEKAKILAFLEEARLMNQH